jgi:hypothetical protein
MRLGGYSKRSLALLNGENVILEIIVDASYILQTVFAVQRVELKKHQDVLTLNLIKMSMSEREKIYRTLEEADDAPDAVLLRGMSQVDKVNAYLPKVPLFVDHCSALELGPMSPLSRAIKKCQRIYCYSQSADTELRRTGTGKITAISGPVIPTDHISTSNGRIVVAVLDTCSSARQVLSRILKVSEAQGWKIEIVSSLKHPKVTAVDNDFEAAELADLVVAPNEDKDFGQPHEGAIIAFAVGKPLVSTRSDAFNVMSFPSNNFIAATKYQIGTYAAAIGNYVRSRERYDEWVEGIGPDPYALPRDFLSRISDG